jgi:flagellar hook-associated protein 1 FlgK
VSLDIARLIAFSGISATELQIAVATSNVTNADTPGYTQKNANQESLVTGGIGTGVSITGITSNVDKLLLKSLIGATSDLGSADAVNSYMTELQQLYGTASSSGTATTGTSLANTLASFESALTSLAGTPSSVSLQAIAVSALDDVASQLRETSNGVQNLRANADQDISSAVDNINNDLQQISDLNVQIKQEAASGQSTADLEDKRNSALQDLSSLMNVSYFTNANGDLQERLFDDDAIILERLASRSVRLDADRGPSLDVSWIGFRELGIWSKPGGAPFLCIEPWRGFASPSDFDGEFADKPGVMQIAPGASQVLNYRIGIR